MPPASSKQDKYVLGGLCYSFRSGSHRRRLSHQLRTLLMLGGMFAMALTSGLV
jgi:hypothetical protein